MLGKISRDQRIISNVQINEQSFLAQVNKKQNVQSDSASTTGIYFPWPQVVAALPIWTLAFLSKTIFEELMQVLKMAINEDS